MCKLYRVVMLTDRDECVLTDTDDFVEAVDTYTSHQNIASRLELRKILESQNKTIKDYTIILKSY